MNPIRTRQPALTGLTLYAVIEDPNAGVWNGTTFDAGSGSWSGYVVALTESPTGVFSVAMPAGINTARLLNVTIYRRVGGSPAATDAVVGVGSIEWTGSAVATASTPMNVNMAQTITDIKTATVGGALNGGWAVAWGKTAKNVSTRVLSIFGAGNTTNTPSATFLLDSALTPTSRTPQ